MVLSRSSAACSEPVSRTSARMLLLIELNAPANMAFIISPCTTIAASVLTTALSLLSACAISAIDKARKPLLSAPFVLSSMNF